MKTDTIAELAAASVIAATGFYLAYRWLLSPLAQRLPAAVGLIVDAVGALLLIPEYACTTVLRRANGHPPPLVFAYGEIVSSLACAFHSCGLVVSDAIDTASMEVGRTQALIGAIVSALCLVLLT
ncbi:hypothetical protein OH802_27410 [Nocardioides sp. NBC_00850]|uniref:hypothetical protein n=1 Tax=Nocardioides sp. NBC_00850 TaxID=2976001 RepID=UPI003865B655|nr:hypothetical protein OH802_27410 [Nocardioides sp. NBC_00850]